MQENFLIGGDDAGTFHFLQHSRPDILLGIPLSGGYDRILQLIIENSGRLGMNALTSGSLQGSVHIYDQLELQPVIDLCHIKVPIPRLIIDDLDQHRPAVRTQVHSVDPPGQDHRRSAGKSVPHALQMSEIPEIHLKTRRDKISSFQLLLHCPDRRAHKALHPDDLIFIARGIMQDHSPVRLRGFPDALIRERISPVLIDLVPLFPGFPDLLCEDPQRIVQDIAHIHPGKCVFLPLTEPQPILKIVCEGAGRKALQPGSGIHQRLPVERSCNCPPDLILRPSGLRRLNERIGPCPIIRICTVPGKKLIESRSGRLIRQGAHCIRKQHHSVLRALDIIPDLCGSDFLAEIREQFMDLSDQIGRSHYVPAGICRRIRQDQML